MTDNNKITDRTINFFLCKWESAVCTIYAGRPEVQDILNNLADAKQHLENGDIGGVFHSFGEAYRIVQKEKA
jgi:hypothetical protein